MDYLSGDLDSSRRAAFELHLVACDGCEAYLDSYARTIALGRGAFADPGGVPVAVPEDLVIAVLAARRAGR